MGSRGGEYQRNRALAIMERVKLLEEQLADSTALAAESEWRATEADQELMDLSARIDVQELTGRRAITMPHRGMPQRSRPSWRKRYVPAGNECDSLRLNLRRLRRPVADKAA